MAEADYRDYVAPAGHPTGSGYFRLVQVAGALTSLALIVGVAFWGYRLAVRDANGVPVIQAMQGPMRIAPEEPGGRVASHLGLSVNRIAAEGSAGTVPDRIVLAPPPVDLADEDTAGVGTAAPDPLPVTLPERRADDIAARNLALAESLVAAAPNPDAVAEAVASALTETLAPLPAGVPHRSPRPRPRPEAMMRGDGLTNATSVVATAPEDIEPEAVAAGARLVQIGAFDDEEAARREWDRVAGLHPALFDGKARIIQPATSAGQTFYRLRVHAFTTDDDARLFCSAVEAGDLRCVPVTIR